MLARHIAISRWSVALAFVPLVAALVMAPSTRTWAETSCAEKTLCAREADAIVASRWAASKHPLVGKAYIPSDAPDLDTLPQKGRLVPISELAALDGLTANGKSPIVLLGEQHDNKEHHWLRSVLAPAAVDAKPVAWVFEQFNESQQPAIDSFLASDSKLAPDARLTSFKASVDWEKSGWHGYDYDALLGAALRANVPIYAGDITRQKAKTVAKQGQSALSIEEGQTFKLDVPLEAGLQSALQSEIEDAHCGMLPKAKVPAMAFAQRYRDAHLASTTLKAASALGRAILFAGNGHVRSDRAVPWYIRRMDDKVRLISVMPIEVENGKTDPKDYVPRDPDGKAAVDVIIFTPPAPREDPCAGMGHN